MSRPAEEVNIVAEAALPVGLANGPVTRDSPAEPLAATGEVAQCASDDDSELERAQLVEMVGLLFGDAEDASELAHSSDADQCRPQGFFRQESADFQSDLEDLLQDTAAEDVYVPDLPDPSECAAIQQEEMEVLQAILSGDLTIVDGDPRTLRVRMVLYKDGENIEYGAIHIHLAEDYPLSVPIFELEVSKTQYLSMTDADYVYDQLLARAMSHIGTAMIYELVSKATALVESLADQRCRRESELANNERKAAQEKTWQKRLVLPWQMQSCDAFEAATPPPQSDGEVSEDEPEPEVVHQGDTTSVRRGCPSVRINTYNPAQFVGPMRKIIAAMPSHLRILRIENILKLRLAERFEACWNKMRTAYWARMRRNFKDINCEPVLAFHGTAEHNLPNIVEKGLAVPGTVPGVRVVHGSCMGVGIYTSPNVETALRYGSRLRVIVCAVLLGKSCQIGSGKTLGDDRATRGKVDSIISSCGTQYAVPCADQVLPCYVIDLAECSGGDEALLPRPGDMGPVKCALAGRFESEQDRRARLTARALKFLPFGFGPSGRRQMVVEAAASLDEDEEMEYTQWGDASNGRDDGSVQVVRSELQQYRYTYDGDEHGD